MARYQLVRYDPPGLQRRLFDNACSPNQRAILKVALVHVHVNKRETNGIAAQHETLTLPGAPPDVCPVIVTASDSHFHTIPTEEHPLRNAVPSLCRLPWHCHTCDQPLVSISTSTSIKPAASGGLHERVLIRERRRKNSGHPQSYALDPGLRLGWGSLGIGSGSGSGSQPTQTNANPQPIARSVHGRSSEVLVDSLELLIGQRPHRGHRHMHSSLEDMVSGHHCHNVLNIVHVAYEKVSSDTSWRPKQTI
jgi:hypothetical protein